MSDGDLAIQLRPACRDDIDVLRALRRNIETQQLLLGHPAADDDTLAWIERREGAADGYFAVIGDRRSGKALGFVQLTDIHGIDRHAFGGIAVAAAERGRGRGRSAMRELMRVARVDHRLRKLMLTVRHDNDAALSLYGSLGFRQVGVLRDHYDDGNRFHDVVLLETLLLGETAL